MVLKHHSPNSNKIHFVLITSLVEHGEELAKVKSVKKTTAKKQGNRQRQILKISNWSVLKHF